MESTGSSARGLSLLARPLPDGFELRLVVLPPGSSRPYEGSDWRGALVTVEQGELVLECVLGGRRSFPRGSVLWLAGLPLRWLHCPGGEAAVLAAVSKRSDEFGPPAGSEEQTRKGGPRP